MGFPAAAIFRVAFIIILFYLQNIWIFHPRIMASLSNVWLFMDDNLTKKWKIILETFFLNMLFLSLARIVFYVLFNPSENPVSICDAYLSFIVGMRFDAATISMIYLVFFLLLLIPVKRNLYYKIIQYLMFWAGAFLYGFIFGDMIYYPHAGRHTSAEIFIVIREWKDIIRMGVKDYLLVLFLGAGFIIAILLVIRKIIIKNFQFERKTLNWKEIFQYSVSIVLVFLLGIIAIRGGLQRKPLMPAMAFHSENLFLGNLSLNGGYTILKALYQKDRLKMPPGDPQKSFIAITEIYRQKGVERTNPEYPFYVHRSSTGNPKKYNIVLFILESFSAKDLSLYGHPADATPFLHSISKKGFLFRNGFATGQRSMAALPSVVSSMPTLYGKLYINSSYQANRQTGLGTLLSQMGYKTFFTYAAFSGSMGFSSYAKIAGFEEIITKESLNAGKEMDDGTWGTFDHYTFSAMNQKYCESEKPFLSVIFSLNPHSPYSLPADYKKKYPPSHPNSDFFNAMRYVDDSLRDFFQLAEKEKYFKNTIFIFTSDHTFGEKNGMDRFRIPILFYAPGIIPPGESSRIASQTDILPTILEILDADVSYSGVGTSLFSPASGRGILDMGDLMGWVADDYLLVVSMEKITGLYNTKKDPFLGKNLIRESSERKKMEAMRKDWESVHFALSYAIIRNRFAP